ncbi:hypothetical protein BCF44_101792 [Kutzneria buriramensis]|uniref:Uncharacterized protein n=1 Tax=Kutzneria buriramensis TaxID=1045776 RepID=A0A3E0IB40_9PSEU|nr:hypothetical protein BCF44_101792 [Kutzneria buriramensis]
MTHRFGATDPVLWAGDMAAGAARAHRLGHPRTPAANNTTRPGNGRLSP